MLGDGFNKFIYIYIYIYCYEFESLKLYQSQTTFLYNNKMNK